VPVAPEVGVVIANYNNSAYVKHAIESAARQTVRGIRVVVVDDASTDGSDEAVRQCLRDLGDERFRYVRLKSNLGQGGAIRRGLAELDTPFVCFLDSDDVWCEEFVARHLVAHMNADFPVAMTFCDSYIIDSNGRMLAGTAWWFDYMSDPPTRAVNPLLLPAIEPETGELAYPRNKGMTFLGEWSLDGATNSMASMMFRRSFVDLVLTPTDEGLRLFVDFYLSTFAWLLTGVIAIHEPLYAYRMHGRNQHSNGKVLGGTYNSSTTSWGPKRDFILRLIDTVMSNDADSMRGAFGDYHYAQAEALLRSALRPQASGTSKRLFAACRAKLAQWQGKRQKRHAGGDGSHLPRGGRP
jgi:glycosyltransferase involved in cell wall biosynthesis